ncbi:MAG: ANR family transcriptional regulator [Moraxella sp.]|nr:ANR family transcriptional regulator [Moraxella sp.]
MIPKFSNLFELEQARQALVLTKLPKNKKASLAEKLGDYRTAKTLWKQVADEAISNSPTQKYAVIRHEFCKSAMEHGYRRPELSYLYA